MELTDVNTSEVETIVEENMVTNAVNNILGLNPMAYFIVRKNHSTGLVWTDNLLQSVKYDRRHSSFSKSIGRKCR